MLVRGGAERLIPRAEGDAGSGGFFEAFDAWEAELWEVLHEVRFSLFFIVAGLMGFFF